MLTADVVTSRVLASPFLIKLSVGMEINSSIKLPFILGLRDKVTSNKHDCSQLQVLQFAKNSMRSDGVQSCTHRDNDVRTARPSYSKCQNDLVRIVRNAKNVVYLRS